LLSFQKNRTWLLLPRGEEEPRTSTALFFLFLFLASRREKKKKIESNQMIL
jgi:hypothetical protein